MFPAVIPGILRRPTYEPQRSHVHPLGAVRRSRGFAQGGDVASVAASTRTARADSRWPLVPAMRRPRPLGELPGRSSQSTL